MPIQGENRSEMARGHSRGAVEPNSEGRWVERGRERGLELVSCSPNSQLLSAEQVHKASLEGFWRGAAG